MTLRTKSRGRQWAVWLCAFLVALAAYVVLTRVMYGAMNWNVLAPLQQRIALPLLALLYVVVTETRWDGVKRKGKKGQGEGEEKAKGQGEGEERSVSVEAKGQGEGEQRNLASDPVVRVTHAHAADGCAREVTSTTEKTDNPCSPSTVDSALAPGEAEYARARMMPHLPVPDCKYDGEYLELLAKSAGLGYPRAMAKLGEYAMRRGCNVEAYYWLWQAKRAGWKWAEWPMLQVRRAWAECGCSRELLNEYAFFSHEQGTAGYALLCIDSHYNAEAAKARLDELDANLSGRE